MSRIFDAVQHGGNDEISQAIVSALTETAETPLKTENNVQALIGAALDNLAMSPTASSPSVLLAPADSQLPAPRHKDVVSLVPRGRTVALKVNAASPLLPFDTQNWRASEQYRTVRTRILQHPREPRIIAVSSAGAGDGKSVTAINIAGALSLKSEANVLLVDADFRRSSLHRQLSLPLSPGLTDILLESCKVEDALVQAEQFPNLYILPAGTRVDNPSDLLEHAGWRKLRRQISEAFRFTVFDCPPIGAVSEWDLLQTASDALIVVGRQDYTNLESLLKAIESIPAEKLIGVVMNCVTDWLFSRASAYDYPQPPK